MKNSKNAKNAKIESAVQKQFSGKVAKYMVLMFVVAIIASFSLTGFQGCSVSRDLVASVDDIPITVIEYQRVLDYELKQFKGRLTQQQIKQYGFKERILGRLIDQKVLINLSNFIGLDASEDEVKKLIKEYPSFQNTNKQFDINRYKQLLTMNKMSPQGFEEERTYELKFNKVQSIFSGLKISDNAAKDYLRFKSLTCNVHAVKVTKDSLIKHIPVSKKTISDFVANKKNKDLLSTIYSSMRNEFVKEAEVQANHILLTIPKGKEAETLAKAKKIRAKLSSKNFKSEGKKLAKSTDTKMEELGWFTAAKMVPPFSKAAFAQKSGSISQPVKTRFGYHIIHVLNKKKAINKKLEQVKEKVAKTHLQRKDSKGLQILVDSVTTQISKALQGNKLSEVKSLKSKYEFEFVEKSNVNLFDLKAGAIGIDEKSFKNALKTKNTKDILNNETASTVTLVKLISFPKDTEINKKLASGFKATVVSRSAQFSRNLQIGLVEKVKKDSKVVTHPGFL